MVTFHVLIEYILQAELAEFLVRSELSYQCHALYWLIEIQPWKQIIYKKFAFSEYSKHHPQSCSVLYHFSVPTLICRGLMSWAPACPFDHYIQPSISGPPCQSPMGARMHIMWGDMLANPYVHTYRSISNMTHALRMQTQWDRLVTGMGSNTTAGVKTQVSGNMLHAKDQFYKAEINTLRSRQNGLNFENNICKLISLYDTAIFLLKFPKVQLTIC